MHVKACKLYVVEVLYLKFRITTQSGSITEIFIKNYMLFVKDIFS